MKITRSTRKFVTETLTIDSWEAIEHYYTDLLTRPLNNLEDFKQWLSDQSELDAILEEDMAWRYIRMTIDTKDTELHKAYTFFVTEIQPKIAPFTDKLNRKLDEAPFAKELKDDQAYFILFRSIRKSLELYREENVPLLAELLEESQRYGALSAAQTILHDGEEITMQKAAMFLRNPDETLRKEVYDKIVERRRKDIDTFHELFEELVKKRHQIAVNAGFENFRDYKLASMGRFDYSAEDCKNFHTTIKQVVVPIVKKMQEERLRLLGKDKFKPWDLDVDPEGKAPLEPFSNGEALLEGTINMFNRIDPYFGDCLSTMKQIQHLDLESKNGKAPGGYNYPLYEIGIPFIFMNAVGSHRDLITMVHEGGHAIHSFLSRDLPLTGFKHLPSEVAELASMSMEMLSMDEWQEFYKEEKDLQRAKKEQLQTVVKLLPWIAQVDEFQHWIYENYEHSRDERTAKWAALNAQYGTGLTDQSGYEDIFNASWQRQLHIYEVPFYYIEYGIAQLGALGIWKNSLSNKSEAIEKYKNALSLGYTKAIPEIYQEAGVQFDFSVSYVGEIMQFMEEQLKMLE